MCILNENLKELLAEHRIVLSEHAKVSGFSPVGLDWDLDQKAELPPLAFGLKNGTKMELVGRIDRVDKAEDDDNVYLRVIDYKSSERMLNLERNILWTFTANANVFRYYHILILS